MVFRTERRVAVTEACRVAISDVPVGAYFTTTIDGRAQLCLKTEGGEVLVLSDDPPHLFLPGLDQMPVTTMAKPRFRPQPDGIEDRTRKLRPGDIALLANPRSPSDMVLCVPNKDAPSDIVIDMETGARRASPVAPGAILSVWSKWEAIDQNQDIVSRYPPRRWTQ
jgi:hypothetical protein